MLQAQDYRQRYAEAKSFFADRRFDKSLDAFRTLMVYDDRNPYMEYARFYHALSAYELNMKGLAKTSLLQLDSGSPDWPQRDEVRYWLGKIYFEEGEPFQAMKWLVAMKKGESAAQLKEKYATEIPDLEVLRMLLEESHDTVIARILIQRLLDLNRIESVAEARRLMASYGYPESRFKVPDPSETKPEGRRISVLFPFLLKSLDASPGTKKNQYVLDLYNGLRLAVDSAAQAGVAVELRAYDTERNPDKILQLTSLPEMTSSDVIVGPLFSEELPIVRDFSSRTRIPMVHPVSSNPEYLTGNPGGFLFLPSFATIGRRSADFAKSLGRPGPVVVVYENSVKDSLMAFAFRQRAVEIGLPIRAFRRISKTNSGQTTEVMKRWFPVASKSESDSSGIVFVASDNELIYSKVISVIDARNDDSVIIGQENWLEKSVVEMAKLEELKVVLAAPNYYDPWSSGYRAFQRNFLRTYGQPPSNYARLGFEFGMFLTRELSATSDGMATALSTPGVRPGVIGGGQEYGGPRDNQVVPMIQLVNGLVARLR